MGSGEAGGGMSGGRGLSFEDMMEGLVMVGMAKYAGQPMTGSVERLMEECVVTHGRGANGAPADVCDDPLRVELRRSKPMRTVLRQLNRPLRELYKFWGASDERDQRTDLVSCKELIAMLLKAGIIGNRLSVVSVKASCMLTLYDSRTAVFGVEHENEHLVFSEFVEVLARCDYIRAVLDPAGRRGEQMAALGGAIKALVLDPAEYNGVLAAYGLDAESAVAAHAAAMQD